MRLLRDNVTASVIYVALLLFSQQFALFYQVQPVIWPVASVFFAVALAYGMRALILPLIVSFIYVSVDVSSGEDSIGMGFSMAVSLVMLLVNYLRVVILVWLFKKFIGLENVSLSSPKMMIRFLIICGPVGGLLGAILVLPPILSADNITWDFQLFLILRWWMAITTGGIIFTPVLLMLLRRRDDNITLRRVYLATSAGAITLLFALLVFVRYELSTEVEAFNDRISTEAERAIERHFDEITDLANSLSTSFELKPELTNQEFQSLALALSSQDTHPVDFLSYSPIVFTNNRIDFEQQFRCTIKGISTTGLITRTEETSYVPVQFLYPQGISDNVLCLDLLSEQTRRQSIYDAINKADAVLSKPVSLANDSGKGVLLVRPVRNRLGDFTGIITAVVNFDSLFNDSLSDDIPIDVFFRFYYKDRLTNDVEVYSRPYDDFAGLDTTVRDVYINFLGQDWRLEWQPSVQLLRAIFNWKIDLFAALGAMLVILVQYISHRLVVLNQTVRSEVRRKTELLHVAKRDAEQAAQTKGQFLANMSHEIRTPLNAILGFAELAKTESSHKTKQEYLDGIWSSSEALLSLINDILDFSKIEAGKLQIHPVRFNVEHIAKRLDAIFCYPNIKQGFAVQPHLRQKNALRRFCRRCSHSASSSKSCIQRC